MNTWQRSAVGKHLWSIAARLTEGFVYCFQFMSGKTHTHRHTHPGTKADTRPSSPPSWVFMSVWICVQCILIHTDFHGELIIVHIVFSGDVWKETCLAAQADTKDQHRKITSLASDSFTHPSVLFFSCQLLFCMLS